VKQRRLSASAASRVVPHGPARHRQESLSRIGFLGHGTRVPGLLNENAIVAAEHNPLDRRVSVTVHNDERRFAPPRLLVEQRRKLDPLDAFDVGAFTEDLEMLDVEMLGRLGDPLIDLAEQSLVPAQAFLAIPHDRFRHYTSPRCRARPATTETGTDLGLESPGLGRA